MAYVSNRTYRGDDDPVTRTTRSGQRRRVQVSSVRDAPAGTTQLVEPNVPGRSYATDLPAAEYGQYPRPPAPPRTRSRPRQSYAWVRRRSPDRDEPAVVDVYEDAPGRERERTEERWADEETERFATAMRPQREMARSRGRDARDDDDDDQSGRGLYGPSADLVDFELDKSNLPQFELESKVSNAQYPPDDQIPFGKPRNRPAGPVQEVNQSQSRWVGDTFDSSEISADLTRAALPTDSHTASPMRWLHLQRERMSFEEFIAFAQTTTLTEDNERRQLVDLLNKVQRDHEKQRQHGREMEPVSLADVSYKDQAAQSTQTSSILFFSIPYFSLQKHQSAHKSLAPGSAVHLARPLVQAKTHMTNEKREMAQVITTRTSTPPGHCLHVPSLWCLVVNETTMLTCSHLTLAELQGDLVKIDAPAQPIKEGFVRITAGIGLNREWRIAPSVVSKWPSMLTMFSDTISDSASSPVSAEILHKNTAVKAGSWPSVIAKASTSVVDLTLKRPETTSGSVQRTAQVRQAQEILAARARRDVASDGITRPISTGDSAPGVEPLKFPTLSPTPAKAQSATALKVFFHACAGQDQALESLADSLDRTLMRSLQSHEREAYEACPEADISDLYRWMNSPDRTKLDPKISPKRAANIDQYKERMLVYAIHTFDFFWPEDTAHTHPRKFLGAVLQIVTNDAFYEESILSHRRQPTDFEITGMDSFDDMFSLTSTLSDCLLTNEQCLLPVHESFYKSWLNVLTSYVTMAAASQETTRSWDDTKSWHYLSRARKDLEDADSELTSRLRSRDLAEFEVCLPKGIASLLLQRVLGDVMHGCPDVAQTYDDYFQQLDGVIRDNAKSRSHQETLRAFQQEVEAVLATLNHQLDVVKVVHASKQEQDKASHLPNLPLLEDSRHDFVLRRCRAKLETKLAQFEDLLNHATDVAQWHLGEIDTYKDKQESAILAFTIVTIIFLPLSFVASVMGMNTNDVRNMEFNQWIYWAAALPLTLVVVGGSLWWTGALEELGVWFARSTARSPAGYERIGDLPAVQTRMRTAGREREYADEGGNYAWVERYEPPPSPYGMKPYHVSRRRQQTQRTTYPRDRRGREGTYVV